MKKFVNITKAAVSTLAVFALLCGGVFAFNHAMAEQSEKNIENNGVAKFVLNDTISEQTKALSGENGTANRSSANVSGENMPSVVWAPDYEETVEKMRANPECYAEIINRDREEARRKKAEEELEAASAWQESPAVVYASDYEETIEKMRANPDNSPEYFDDYIRAKWGDRQSETMVAAE